jgi:maltooligosyltrehalose trehalohydrolase
VIDRSPDQRVDIPLQREPRGYYSALVHDTGPGTRYWFRVDGRLAPDPASRRQPDGPFGPSEVVDPTFAWTDHHWKGVTLPGQVLYEMHVGTFTQEGTWRAAIERLPMLHRTGITAVEVMPVADFPGRFGWGYDGVFLFAPTRLYGSPDDFRLFVDRAHQIGLGVVLDVVYNHFGPSGSVFREYSDAYFTDKYENDWGDALNFDGTDAAQAREYYLANAAYWIDEFHLDGLRLDAIHSINDASRDHIVAAITRAARQAAGNRSIIAIVENEAQKSHVLRPPDRGGYGVDAAWNDDFHHSAVVALTGRNEAYFSDHQGRPQEFVSAAKYGFLFQGQRYAWQKQGRGSRADGIASYRFVNFTENHDQLANSGIGERLHTRCDTSQYRAMTALLLLMPGTPMLFQGQEFGATSKFLYFADHEGELAEAVRKGRAEFVRQFPTLATSEAQRMLPPPHAMETFEQCKLRWEEYDANIEHRRLHEDLIALRRSDRAFSAVEPHSVDGAVLGDDAFVLRYAAGDAIEERLVVVNFGRDLNAPAFPEPLLAPPDAHDWTTRWSSESTAYGGCGAYEVATPEGWRIPGHSATVLAPVKRPDGGPR